MPLSSGSRLGSYEIVAPLGAGGMGEGIGDGQAYAFSPDGKEVLATVLPDRKKLIRLPTGAGEPVPLPETGLWITWAYWFPDARRILLSANEPDCKARMWVQDVAGGKPVPITPEGVSITWGQIISPDGRSIVARGADGRLAVYPTEPGEPRLVPGVAAEETPIRWSKDGRSFYVTRQSEPPVVVELVDVETGRRTPWKTFQPFDTTGIDQVGPVIISPDEKAYVYGIRLQLGELYLARGLR